MTTKVATGEVIDTVSFEIFEISWREMTHSNIFFPVGVSQCINNKIGLPEKKSWKIQGLKAISSHWIQGTNEMFDTEGKREDFYVNSTEATDTHL